jgi:hypothetical protein
MAMITDKTSAVAQLNICVYMWATAAKNRAAGTVHSTHIRVTWQAVDDDVKRLLLVHFSEVLQQKAAHTQAHLIA